MSAEEMLIVIADLATIPIEVAAESSMPQMTRIVKTARLFFELPESELTGLNKEKIKARFEDCYIKTFPEEIQKYCEKIPMTTLLKEVLLSSGMYKDLE